MLATVSAPFSSFRVAVASDVRPGTTSSVIRSTSPRWETVTTATYISFFAQLGVAGRILVGELFAGNCSERLPNTRLSWTPCVASAGTDSSNGGALFRDLPANMIGCLIIGFLASTATLKTQFPALDTEERALAALPSQNPAIQQNTALQVGLRTGFCGSLTTFASWKLQMVQMLLAGKGAYHGSQWLGVGLGLILGVMTGLASLVAGQHCAVALLSKYPQKSTNESLSRSFPILTLSTGLLLATSTGLALGGVFRLNGLEFWRKFSLALLLAPFGALLRWQLAAFNGSTVWKWLPLGTLVANLLACVLSFTSQGVDTRWTGLHTSYKLLLYALRTGLAGALSTVSTWVVEIQVLFSRIESLHRGYFYLILSQLAALGFGVMIYGSFLWV